MIHAEFQRLGSREQAQEAEIDARIAAFTQELGIEPFGATKS